MIREVIFNAEPLGFSPRARQMWEALGEYHEGDLDTAADDALLARATVLIVRLARRIDGGILERAPALRTVISATTGLDHLDQAAMAARRIDLVSLRGETEFLSTIPSTAEHTLALMLGLLRKLPSAVQSVAAGEWQRDRFRGRQMKGRRLGLVGLGRTGSMVAHYAAALGMDISYYDPHVEQPAYRRHGSLAELLRASEIVSLHVHLTEQTCGMIGMEEIAALADGAWLINTSRGGLVDEQALADAVLGGRLAGVATDVLATELHDIERSPLLRAQRAGANVMITPHIGGATADAMHACEEFIVQKYAGTLSVRPEGV